MFRNRLILCVFMASILFILISGLVVMLNPLIQAKGNQKYNFQIFSTIEGGDKYEEFLSDETKIDKMACFYNAMVDRNEFDYASMGSQHIVLNKKKLKKETQVTYGTADSIYYENDQAVYGQLGVKAIQVSKEGLSRFGVADRYIKEIDWEGLDFNKEIPAILGQSYKSSIAIGDKFAGNDYISDKSWKNIGYIEEGKQLYYGYHNRLNLDNYIIYAFPLHSVREKFSSVREYGVVTDSMLFGNLIPNTPLILDHLKIIAKQESERCGFREYDIVSDFPNDDVEYHKQHINQSYQKIIVIQLIVGLISISLFYFSLKRVGFNH